MGQENSVENKAAELLRLHQDPTLLTVVNVWDSISAKVVADTPGTAALATASHSIAASLGYPDGEKIPADLMIEAVGRIVEATTLPVTADLEGGYGDPTGTVRKAIGVGVVGANIEDQMRPLEEAVALLVRERLTGIAPPASARKLVDLWRNWIEEKAGPDLQRQYRAERGPEVRHQNGVLRGRRGRRGAAGMAEPEPGAGSGSPEPALPAVNRLR